MKIHESYFNLLTWSEQLLSYSPNDVMIVLKKPSRRLADLDPRDRNRGVKIQSRVNGDD